MRIIFFILILTFPLQKGLTQCLPTWLHTDSLAYETALKKLTILKSEQDILPLKALENWNPVCNTTPNATITKILNCYLPFSTLKNKRTKDEFNLQLFAFFDKNDFQNVRPAFETNQKVIFLLFGEEAKMTFDKKKWNQKATAVLFHPDKNNAAQSVMVQTIFGGIGIRGIDDNKNTGQPVRLGYAPPGVVGLNDTLLENGIDRIVQNGLEQGAFPGAQILVAKKGKVIFWKAYGHHKYDKVQKVKPDDLYDLASITKIAGPLPALLKLHSERKFNLSATLKDYLPYFENSNKANLNFTDILAHRARLEPWIPFWKDAFKKNGRFKRKTFRKKSNKRYPYQLATDMFVHRKFKNRIYEAIKKSSLREKAGYKYSGLAFYLFPEIIAKQTGEAYENYLYRNFYKKIGATTLCYNPATFFDKNKIVPTEFDSLFRKELIHGKVHDEGAILMQGVSGNAGLFSNANDLAKLMQLYLQEGKYGGTRFFSPESMQKFNSCPFCKEGNRRGLGFDKPLVPYHPQNSSTAKDASSDSFGHGGFTGTCVWVDPAEELIFIFLSNRVYPTRENKKLYRLNIRPEIHQAIYNAILNH